MSKETENGTIKLNQIPERTQAEIESHNRVKLMTDKVIETILKLVEEKENQYTTFEIVDAMLVISHGYNKRGLKMQHNDQNQGS